MKSIRLANDQPKRTTLMILRLEKIGGKPPPPKIMTRGGPGDTKAMAIDDIVSGALLWRLWGRLGWNDILQRYRRSLLGPFWLTASMAIMVVALGVLYAEIFKIPVDKLMPYLSVGLVIWTLISSFLTEAGTLFTSSESYIKQI